MNRRYSRNNKPSKIKEILLSYLEKNLKEYFIIAIIFFIGIIIGIIFINNASENQTIEISNYISSFIKELKESKEVNEISLLKDSIHKNCVLAIILWFMGSTVIGILIVYITIAFRGFCLGYTISSIIFTCGIRERTNCTYIYYVTSKYIIYTVHNGNCSKWNEIT